MKKGLFAILTAFALAGVVFAGGSFDVERVMPLLKQNSDIYEFVLRNLELERSGGAVRIGGRVNPDLGGARIAPYTIRAKPKGSNGGWVFYLEIEADTTYYDDKGREVSLEEGKRMGEKLIGVRVLPILDGNRG